ncbi:helix-turn-helix domain-containing protein [Streptantibioticus silvisoli]|uniref:XRE family transcriptional regulator n=1 Tax=Streptantibioticus silvisoli TaxID=2705255 RepID=A0ABT6W257_9ACTN|nr:XRE family transcriptional regulator [Streptantibioticus silvisoli]MDI5964827.1 XRE family transcriptional regulator [Streptantibioticus silvisoli]
MTTPNTTLRAIRTGMNLSQDEFARVIRDAGHRLGRPNDATKRLVQRWEAGGVAAPRGIYISALEVVTGLPVASLGFNEPQARVQPDGKGGHDMAMPPGSPPATKPAAKVHAHEGFTGIWLSRYEYFSSGRDASLVGLHHVVLLQHGNRISGRSLPNASSNPDSPLTFDLTVDGSVVTGTWVEQTAEDGYYRGARYHGSVQMLAEPTGRRMVGKWVGFGKDMDVNTGPWELALQSASTDKTTLNRYSQPPQA